jgi:hypothetical protein
MNFLGVFPRVHCVLRTGIPRLLDWDNHISVETTEVVPYTLDHWACGCGKVKVYGKFMQLCPYLGPLGLWLRKGQSIRKVDAAVPLPCDHWSCCCGKGQSIRKVYVAVPYTLRPLVLWLRKRSKDTESLCSCTLYFATIGPLVAEKVKGYGKSMQLYPISFNHWSCGCGKVTKYMESLNVAMPLPCDHCPCALTLRPLARWLMNGSAGELLTGSLMVLPSSHCNCYTIHVPLVRY